MSRAWRALAIAVAWIGPMAPVLQGAGTPGLLGDTVDPARWLAAPADGVQLEVGVESPPDGPVALRLDFDFQGRGGWAAARLPVALELPPNWELRFRVRGEAPVNHFEVKLIDESGENVWWSVRREFEFPREWTAMRIKKRQVRFAWGPARGGEPSRLGAIELVVTAGSGGRGTVWITDLELVPKPPQAAYAGTPLAAGSAEASGHAAGLALDGDPTTAWRAPAADAETTWTLDFGTPRELGGLTLRWEAGRQPACFSLEASDDGQRFRSLRDVMRAGGGRNDFLLPETETRWLRLRVPSGTSAAREIGLAEVEVRPLEFGESRNRLFETLARESDRGLYPRGFSGEQVYWTVAGADGAQEEVLVSEDGAVELGALAPSLEPFVYLDGQLWSWARTVPEQWLAGGDLPIPTVAWPLPGMRLEATALVAAVPPASSVLAVRYRLTNIAAEPRTGALFVAARPFQVNPPSQFLNLAGGVAGLRHVACGNRGMELDGRRVLAAPAAQVCGAAAFDEGPVTEWLRHGEVPPATEIADDFGHASGALGWPFRLGAGEAREVVLAVALDPGARAAAEALAATATAQDFTALEAATSATWRERLDRVEIDVPANAATLVRTLHTGLAAILVHRDGAALQPGSRAYARSWIRDGALTGAALLRLGHADAARDFALWYAGFLYPDGKVPCCVDRRGADPVPENDSHGEWIHLVAEITRYTGDLAFARRLFPTIERTVGYLDALRASRRTDAYRDGDGALFFGLLPESISHEGYSEKPMHSYWDDAFAYRGYADAVVLAEAIGRPDLATPWAASRDRFLNDLLSSLARAGEHHRIDYLPGAAELGDFDATSSTVLLEPAGLGGALPRAAVAATFDRYYREFEERRDGRRSWEVYTPYELRAVGAFVRLGQRDRAHALLDYFLAGRRPAAWNQWAEVVFREPRTPRFLGDLPHGWVASDFARSFLDLFAYERREDGALILGAGLPRRWFAGGEAVGIRRLRTPWGELSFTSRLVAGRLQVDIQPLSRWPPGGVGLELPLADGARVSIDGGAAQQRVGRSIVLDRLPAVVVVESPW